jgi:hypothetical protein
MIRHVGLIVRLAGRTGGQGDAASAKAQAADAAHDCTSGVTAGRYRWPVAGIKRGSPVSRWRSMGGRDRHGPVHARPSRRPFRRRADSHRRRCPADACPPVRPTIHACQAWPLPSRSGTAAAYGCSTKAAMVRARTARWLWCPTTTRASSWCSTTMASAAARRSPPATLSNGLCGPHPSPGRAPGRPRHHGIPGAYPRRSGRGRRHLPDHPDEPQRLHPPVPS